MRRAVRILMIAGVLGLIGAGGWFGYSRLQAVTTPASRDVPTTKVRRGDVAFTVASKGALQGGNSKMLVAPMTGSPQLVITTLRKPGEMVTDGEIVAQFDTTEESFKLREAEADLAEAEQQVIQAKNEALAKEEELEYEVLKARSDLAQAELECRRNPLMAPITAQQNDLSLADAKDRLGRIERDYPQRKAAATASIAIQEAAQKKATVQADTARRNIDNMTLKAPASGYVNVERNTNSNWYFPGMTFPLLQVGDQVRSGMGVVQIPDMSSWEVTAEIAELDRGHLSVGQPAEVRVVALPGQAFRASISDLGGTTGPPWNRRFECKLKLADPAPELRPGMSARIIITTQTMKDVLWLPAQALMESDGRTFIYLANATGGFTARDVKLLRRSESRVVIDGAKEGELVALASPDQKEAPGQKQNSSSGGAAKAMSK